MKVIIIIECFHDYNVSFPNLKSHKDGSFTNGDHQLNKGDKFKIGGKAIECLPTYKC